MIGSKISIKKSLPFFGVHNSPKSRRSGLSLETDYLDIAALNQHIYALQVSEKRRLYPYNDWPQLSNPTRLGNAYTKTHLEDSR